MYCIGNCSIKMQLFMKFGSLPKGGGVLTPRTTSWIRPCIMGVYTCKLANYCSFIVLNQELIERQLSHFFNCQRKIFANMSNEVIVVIDLQVLGQVQAT